MPLVIADTSPINDLILIEHIDLLPRLFERVVIPGTVHSELSSHDAPPAVQRWIANPPAWLEMIDTSHVGPFAGLHKGESAAIALAESLQSNLLLMDERKGVKVARDRGLYVTGILGLLELAAQHGLLNLAEAFARLKRTSFRSPQGLLDLMLARNAKQNEL